MQVLRNLQSVAITQDRCGGRCWATCIGKCLVCYSGSAYSFPAVIEQWHMKNSTLNGTTQAPRMKLHNPDFSTLQRLVDNRLISP